MGTWRTAGYIVFILVIWVPAKEDKSKCEMRIAVGKNSK
jgi:hypothetical protein